MHISKLTITPVVLQAPKVVIKTPSNETALLLIKEKLCTKNSLLGNKTYHPKLPKFLRGFVNPKSYIGSKI